MSVLHIIVLVRSLVEDTSGGYQWRILEEDIRGE